MSGFRDGQMKALRAKISQMESHGRNRAGVMSLGDARLDDCFPGGGLPLGQWHAFTGEGMEAETSACPAAFAALLAAPLTRRGEAVWILRRDDLFAPGLAGLGFPADRLIQVCARDEAEALAVAEDALATVGISAVFIEVDAVDLVAGRRLQLACEARGSTGLVIHRYPWGGASPATWTGSAAASRWRIRPAPSLPPPGEFGLGPPRWQASLDRCRGGRPGTWLFEADHAYSHEAQDGTHPLRLVAPLGAGELVPATPFQRSA